MTPMPPERDLSVAILEATIRRVVAARVADPERTSDIVQETLARVLARRPQLSDDVTVAYGIVVARNLMRAEGRAERRFEHVAPELADLGQPDGPEEVTLRREEHEAVRRALATLSPEERDALVAHEVEGVPAETLARRTRSTPGAVAVRLARARARLRVEYLLALRRVRLPTDRCRPVLLAISNGERRRQRRLQAGDHLLECATCAALSDPLLQRRRSLAALWPVAVGLRAARWLRRQGRERPVQTAAAGATVVATVITGLLIAPPAKRSAKPVQSAALTITTTTTTTTNLTAAACADRISVNGIPSSWAQLVRGAHPIGAAIVGDGLPVQSVPGDEGFWVGCGTEVAWVQLVGTGESPSRVTPGARVSFSGTIAQHGPNFAASVGVDSAEGAERLDRQGRHVEVTYAHVAVS